jgi:hypothetical protein
MFFAGLAQGFSQAQEQDRALQAQVDEQSAQREQATLLHLATTHPDPEVRASAMGAMLTPRQPAGGFMGRMFNAAKTNPAMPSLMALMGSQRQVPVMGQQQTEPGPSTMQEPGAGTLATPPPGATGELGIPQASMADTHNLLPQGAAVSQPVQTGTRMVSRGAPPTGAQVAGQTAYEQSLGGMAGTFAGLSTGGPVSAATREIVGMHKAGVPETVAYDPQGNRRVFVGTEEVGAPNMGVGRVQGRDEPAIQTQITNLLSQNPGMLRSEAETQARSAAATTTQAQQSTVQSRSVSAAASAAVAAPLAQARMEGMRARAANDLARLPGIQMTQELQRRTLNGQLTADEATRYATQIVIANRGTTDDINEMVTALTGGTVGRTPTAPAAPAAQPPPGGPAAPGAAPVLAAPPPGATPATPPAAVPLEVQALLKGAVPGQHTLSDNSVWNLSPTGIITPGTPAGAAPVAGGTMPAAPTAAPTTPAAPTAPTAPTPTPALTPQQKPGLPPNLNVAKLGEQEQGAHDVITTARPMMERARVLISQLGGGASDNSVGAKARGMKAAVQSWAGFNPSSPAYKELLPLLQHIRVYALSPYLHGIRNGAFVAALQENAPENTDTPAHMTVKLDNLEKNFADIEAGFGSAPPPAKAAIPPPAK